MNLKTFGNRNLDAPDLDELETLIPGTRTIMEIDYLGSFAASSSMSSLLFVRVCVCVTAFSVSSPLLKKKKLMGYEEKKIRGVLFGRGKVVFVCSLLRNHGSWLFLI